MNSRYFFIPLIAVTLLSAGCAAYVGSTKRFKTSGAATSLSSVAVEFVAPHFNVENPATQAALFEWTRISSLGKDETPRVFARAQVAAVVVDEHSKILANPAAAACRYVLVITLSSASASATGGYHNEMARVTLVDLKTHEKAWDGDTYLAGGLNGFEVADIDKFLTGLIAAMHEDGVFDHTAD